MAFSTPNGSFGSIAVLVQDEGVAIPNGPHYTVNFVGAGVTAADAGAGVATVTIPGGGGGEGGGGGGSFAGQLFSYSVTGAESDLSEITITMPVAELSTAYVVVPSQGQATNHLGMNVATSSKTLTTFVLSLSNVATAGDTFMFMLAQPT